jgi:hypothetical protein
MHCSISKELVIFGILGGSRTLDLQLGLASISKKITVGLTEMPPFFNSALLGR